MKAEYDRIAAAWDRARHTLPPLDAGLFERFSALLPPGSTVLDLGCGTGRPIGEWLAARGAAIVGIDRSERLLARARDYVPGGEFVRQELEDFRAEQWRARDPFDGAVCWDCLFHIPRERHRGILAELARSVRAGAPLILSSGGSEQAPFTDVMFDVEFFYDAHPPAALLALCREIGFEVAEFLVLNAPDGKRDKGRIGVILKNKPAHD
jgi:2-polyprenyl-3-methyl-5-hydroxy-6-metoxy-1,4-benzoquinol methylase